MSLAKAKCLRAALASLVLLLPCFITGAIAASPVVVLCHGLWSAPYAWNYVKPMLTAMGYEVYTPQMPGHGTDTTPYSKIFSVEQMAAPAAAVVASLPAGRKAVLVGHSFAGEVISTVAEKHPDKVSHLIYVAAFLLPNNGSLVKTASLEPSLLNQHVLPLPQSNPDVLHVQLGYRVGSFAQLSPPKARRMVQRGYRDAPLYPLADTIKVTTERWGSIPRFYTFSDQDNAINTTLQQRMVKEVGVQQTFHISGSDHTVALSQPAKLAAVLKKIVEG